jgi:hypothetical protein
VKVVLLAVLLADSLVELLVASLVVMPLVMMDLPSKRLTKSLFHQIASYSILYPPFIS